MQGPKVGAKLIELEGVTKTFGAGDSVVHALRGVNLCIDGGDFVSVMGPSGSGKSTAMNILGCLDVPTSGSYRFKGIAVQALTLRQRALLRRNYIGFIFQGFNLLPRITALKNVALPLLYRGTTSHERTVRAQAALRAVGLQGRETHTPSELSGGEQQRVAIARAIVTNPEVLLADEPTGNLDTSTSRDVMELITKINRDQGITVVMVTHEEDIAAYARRQIRFLDGRVETDTIRAEAA